MAKRVPFFKVLRQELGSVLEATRLVEVPHGVGGASHILQFETRLNETDVLGLWFQRDVKGTEVEIYGSSFTVEFYRSFDLDDRERIFYLLTPYEREAMREVQNRMIARLPPSTNSPVTTLSAWLDGKLRAIISEPFNPLHDVWMRYRDEEDIRSWTDFLRPILPAVIARFEIKVPRRSK